MLKRMQTVLLFLLLSNGTSFGADLTPFQDALVWAENDLHLKLYGKKPDGEYIKKYKKERKSITNSGTTKAGPYLEDRLLAILNLEDRNYRVLNNAIRINDCRYVDWLMQRITTNRIDMLPFEARSVKMLETILANYPGFVRRDRYWARTLLHCAMRPECDADLIPYICKNQYAFPLQRDDDKCTVVHALRDSLNEQNLDSQLEKARLLFEYGNVSPEEVIILCAVEDTLYNTPLPRMVDIKNDPVEKQLYDCLNAQLTRAQQAVAEQKAKGFVEECCKCRDNSAQSMTACRHWFCKTCIDDWMKGHDECPTCCMQLRKDEVFDYTD